jgi:hypothetical protein
VHRGDGVRSMVKGRVVAFEAVAACGCAVIVDANEQGPQSKQAKTEVNVTGRRIVNGSYGWICAQA